MRYNIVVFVKSWWDYFHDDPYERIGRLAPCAFGHPIVVELPRIAWAYLDWIEEMQGTDDGEFFIANDRIRDPSKETIHEAMESAVGTLYLRRERAGSPRPEWCPPVNPADYIDI